MGKGGGGGLGFLNKKSWHTAGMRQQEEVWKEQEYAKEQRKLVEHQKQIKEERKREELEEVAATSGHVKCVSPPNFPRSHASLSSPRNCLSINQRLNMSLQEGGAARLDVRWAHGLQAGGRRARRGK